MCSHFANEINYEIKLMCKNYAPVSTLLVYAYVRGQCHGHSADCGTSTYMYIHVHVYTCMIRSRDAFLYAPSPKQ